MSDLVTKAADFAKSAHESIDQRRKYTNEPYIAHPIAVAGLLDELNLDPETLVAAILHDVVEDTGVTLDEISEVLQRFPLHHCNSIAIGPLDALNWPDA